MEDLGGSTSLPVVAVAQEALEEMPMHRPQEMVEPEVPRLSPALARCMRAVVVVGVSVRLEPVVSEGPAGAAMVPGHLADLPVRMEPVGVVVAEMKLQERLMRAGTAS